MKSRYLPGLIFVVSVALLALLPSDTQAQFAGKEREITDDSLVPDTYYRQSVVVWGKKTFGVFWIEEEYDGDQDRICYARLNKKGKLKGKIMYPVTGDWIETLDVVWTGRAFCLAFDMYYKSALGWYHQVHVARVSVKGKLVGQIRRPSAPYGDLVRSEGPSVAWNGTHIGLAYVVDIWGDEITSGVYFQRLDGNLNNVGQRVKLGGSGECNYCDVASNGNEFVAGWLTFRNANENNVHLHRVSNTGAKVGNLVTHTDAGRPGYLNLLNFGNGYAVAYNTTWTDEVKVALFDSNLNRTEGPVTVNNGSDCTDRPVLTGHGNQLWIFWKQYDTDPDLGQIWGAKLNSNAGITTQATQLTTSNGVLYEYPLGADSSGKRVLLAFWRYNQDPDEDRQASAFSNCMK